MSKIQRIGDLDIDQDLNYQRRAWLVERVGRALMALLILAALFGLLGNGPVSFTRVADPVTGLGLEYDRFLHNSAGSNVRVHVPPPASGEFRLWMSQAYLDAVRFRQIVPEPFRVEAGRAGATFVFRAAEPGQAAVVVFRIEPERPGSVPGEVRLGDGPPVRFEQFVYP